MVMVSDFQWTETQFGYASCVLLVLHAASDSSGVLVDRYGVRLPYILGFLLWSVASMTMSATTNLGMLIGLRLLLGAGESVVTPSRCGISGCTSPNSGGLAVGLYMTGTKIDRRSRRWRLPHLRVQLAHDVLPDRKPQPDLAYPVDGG
jgi:MFS family permease